MPSSLRERRTTNNNNNRLNLSGNQDNGDKRQSTLFPVNEENGLNAVELKTVSPDSSFVKSTDTEFGQLEVRNWHSFSSGNLTTPIPPNSNSV